MDRSQKLKQLRGRAEQIYKNNLEEMLQHPNEFVVIDTISKNYVFGKTLTEALRNYRDARYEIGAACYSTRLNEKGEIAPYSHRIHKLAS